MGSGMSWRRCLLGIAALCVGSVAVALAGQYLYDVRPCPWCILQRFIFIVIAMVAMIAAVADAASARRFFSGLIVLLAGAAGASALYQHFVAAKSASCNLSLADRIITALRLETLVPDLFAVTAACGDPAKSLLGLPFEVWSLLLSLVVAATAIYAMRRHTRSHARSHART